MRRVFTAAGLSVAALLTAAACGSAPTGSQPAAGVPPPATSAASAHAAADVAFAQQMIPHHRQVIAMAGLAPTRAASPKVKDLATQIKNDQGAEIATMTSWLQGWHAPPAKDEPGGGSAMGGMDRAARIGMVSNQQMSQLVNSSGTAFDRLFLQLMIGHHQGAVQMATTELATGRNPDAKNLATSIQRGQTAQIATMRKLLAGI
ncbi:MAG: DUF305 domain-containing protein [Pseudonocardiales bacterium]|nr:DUF305 domain-containing protein [Actinomycetota bacterium]PZS24093.1 MAG: DUF305 domain-containing protein [Pseudonocardiales bacterium]